MNTHESSPPLLLIGCGYTAERVGRIAVAAGRTVWATTRERMRAEALNRLGLHGVVFTPGAGAPPRLADVQACDVVYSIPPADEPIDAAVGWAAAHGARRIIYLSATSVWGGDDGEWVEDDTPTDPTTARGRRRLAHERQVRTACESASVPMTALRLPGIWGPGRTGVERLLDSPWKMAGDGSMWSNRVHVDDIASAVFHLLARAEPAEAALASDGHPFRVREFARHVRDRLGAPEPVYVEIDELAPIVRDFWRTSKRCRPRLLLAEGWRPAYPSFLDAVVDEWKAEARTPPAG